MKLLLDRCAYLQLFTELQSPRPGNPETEHPSSLQVSPRDGSCSSVQTCGGLLTLCAMNDISRATIWDLPFVIYNLDCQFVCIQITWKTHLWSLQGHFQRGLTKGDDSHSVRTAPCLDWHPSLLPDWGWNMTGKPEDMTCETWQTVVRTGKPKSGHVRQTHKQKEGEGAIFFSGVAISKLILFL